MKALEQNSRDRLHPDAEGDQADPDEADRRERRRQHHRYGDREERVPRMLKPGTGPRLEMLLRHPEPSRGTDDGMKEMPEGVRRELPAKLGRDAGYLRCVSDLIRSERVRSMKNYVQHGEVSCLEHCLYVSYVSYRVCRKWRLDSCSAARGALLHDFFLYDWHTGNPYGGLHAFQHPRSALRNADRYFALNPLEREIILRHMWPLTPMPPRHPEAFIVSLADKYCALMETVKGNAGGFPQML